MAVYSDRIVLKTSIDTEAQIIDQIKPGGSSEISIGELVVGLTPGYAQLYSLDSNGEVVVIGGATAATSLAGLTDVDVTTNPPTNLQSLAWDEASGYWVPSTPIVGATELDGLSDVNLQANGVADKYLLSYNSFSGQWEATDNIGSITMHNDVAVSGVVTGESLIWNNVAGRWENGLPNIVGLARVEDDIEPSLGGGLNVNEFPITSASLNTGEGNIDFLLLNGGAEIRFQHNGDDGLDRTTLAWYDLDDPSNYGAYFRLRPARPDPNDPNNPEPYGWTFTFPSNKGSSGYGLATDGNGTSYWKDYRLVAEANPALGADLDTTGYEITSETGVVISADEGWTLFKHTNLDDNVSDQPGEIRIESASGDYAGLTAPSLTSSYTLALPEDNGQGKVGYALVADGSGGSYWATGVAADLSATSINALVDVDTVTSAPVNNEALVWDSAQGLWVPGSVPANLAGNTLGQVGDVDVSGQADNDVLVWDSATSTWISQQRGIQDQTDYALEETQALTFVFASGSAENAGEWEAAGNTAIIVNNFDNTATSFQSYILSFTDQFPPTFAISGQNEVGTWTTSALVSVVNNGTSWTLSSDSTLTLPSGTLYLTLEDAPVALPLEDGKVLAYSAAQNKFVPVTNTSGTLDYNELQNTPDVPQYIDDLDDVDTTTISPLTGQVLEWDGTSWVPGDGNAITAVTSVNEKTGRVFLNFEDLLDVGLEGQPGRDFSYNTNINDAGADYANEGVWGSAGGGADLLISTRAVGGEDLTEIFQAIPTTGNLWVYTSSSGIWNGPATYTDIELDYAGTGAVRFQDVGILFTSATGVDIKIAIVDPTTTTIPNVDKDIVLWNASKFRYEPTTITEVSGGTFGSG